jgi:hypothetical protein
VKLSDWIMVAAIILGPILAVQVEKIVEGRRERKRARLGIFYTLMQTRANRVDATHVQALNSIDFHFRKDRRVVDAWKVYLDHLNTTFADAQLEAWVRRGEDLLVDLLAEMAEALGYVFDKVQIKRAIYAPRAHAEYQLDSVLIRRSLAEILSGRRAIPVRLSEAPADVAPVETPRAPDQFR